MPEATLPEIAAVAAKAKSTISARVYRAETDTWEDYGVIAETDLTQEQLDEIRKNNE